VSRRSIGRALPFSVTLIVLDARPRRVAVAARRGWDERGLGFYG
jgi:hypothetical protein